MIEKNWPESGYHVMCDSCSNELEIETDSWAVMIRKLKREGWRNYKVNIYDATTPHRHYDEWRNICPTCISTNTES